MAQPAPYPENEVQRLEALRACQVLDTIPELAFDDLTFLAGPMRNLPMEFAHPASRIYFPN